MRYFVAAVFGVACKYAARIKPTKCGVQVFQNLFNGIGCRKLNAAVLLVTDDRLFRSLTNRHAIFFLVHWSYLLKF